MRDERANQDSVSGEVHGNFVACPLLRPGFEPSTVIPVPWLQCKVWRGRRRPRRTIEAHKFSPVVKRKVTSHQSKAYGGSRGASPAEVQSAGTPGSARIWGVVPKLRVAAETGIESNLFSHVPRRVLKRLF